MNRIIIIVVAALRLALPAVADDRTVTLTWLGQSCFALQSPGGVTVLMDPFGKTIGYPVGKVSANVVTISHEHFDHNNLEMATGSPLVIRGLKDGDWAPVDRTVGDVHITTVSLYHDEKQGAERGKNMAFIFETSGKRIVHLGDLGHPITPEQVKQFGRVDVLLIPVGGVYTIDAPAAAQVMRALKPAITIPMHYKTPALNIPLAPVTQFIAGRKNVTLVRGSRLEIGALPAEPVIYVLEPGTWPKP
mgnify:CR=1 FL=1